MQLFIACLVVLAALSMPVPRTVHAASSDTPEPPTTAPPVTMNEFLPETENLSDCIGVLERPGCGSRERGGWRQTLVFVAMASGLVLIFGRIAWSVRAARRQ